MGASPTLRNISNCKDFNSPVALEREFGANANKENVSGESLVCKH